MIRDEGVAPSVTENRHGLQQYGPPNQYARGRYPALCSDHKAIAIFKMLQAKFGLAATDAFLRAKPVPSWLSTPIAQRKRSPN
jgi:hypothetical protein